MNLGEEYVSYLKRLFNGFQIDLLTAVRFMMGWVFFSSGLAKLMENGLNYGYASKYLAEAASIKAPQIAFTFPEILQLPGVLLIEGVAFLMEPMMTYFSSLNFIGALVIITELFIGLSLLLGFLTRPGAIIGSFMMVMFYFGNSAWGNGLLNSDFVYLVLMVFIAVSKAGERIRLDSYLMKKYKIENKALKKFLGF